MYDWQLKNFNQVSDSDLEAALNLIFKTTL